MSLESRLRAVVDRLGQEMKTLRSEVANGSVSVVADSTDSDLYSVVTLSGGPTPDSTDPDLYSI